MLEQEMRFLQHVALREIGHGMAWHGSGVQWDFKSARRTDYNKTRDLGVIIVNTQQL